MTIETQLAEYARRAIEVHDEWDSMHHLLLICRLPDDTLVVDTYAGIDPALDPGVYPTMMEKMAKAAADRGKPPFAMLLQIEAYEATLSKEERDRMHEDGSQIADRPDREEACCAWVTDVNGRAWSAMKRRGKAGIEEDAYEPGSPAYNGRFIQGMLDALLIYGSEYPVKENS